MQLLNDKADYYERTEMKRGGKDDDLMEYIASLKPKSVLEVGCGYGRCLQKLEGKGIILTGIDFANELVKRAKAKCKEAEIIKMDLTQMSFQNNSFDVVFSVVALFCVPDIEKAISEIKRVANEAVLIREPCKENTPVLARFIHKWYVNCYDYERFGFTRLPMKEVAWIWKKRTN